MQTRKSVLDFKRRTQGRRHQCPNQWYQWCHMKNLKYRGLSNHFGGSWISIPMKWISSRVAFGCLLRLVSAIIAALCFMRLYAYKVTRYIPNSSPTNACSQVRGSVWLSCHADHHEVSRTVRCCTRGESEGWICCVQETKHASKGIHPGFETQDRHHQESKTGVSVAHKKRLVLQFFFLKITLSHHRK